jgi:hypothetical protein
MQIICFFIVLFISSKLKSGTLPEPLNPVLFRHGCKFRAAGVLEKLTGRRQGRQQIENC